MERLDDFDRLLKEKAKKEVFQLPEEVDMKINNIIKSLPNKSPHRKVSIKIALIAAAVATLSITTVFALDTSFGKNVIGQVISYFNNSSTKYYENKASFEKFNRAVGVAAEDKGIKLTLDNLAIDDNFMNVFFTIESNKPIDMKFTEENTLFKEVLSVPLLHFKINGNEIDYSNNNDIDAYFQGENTLKVMRRINVSQVKLPKNFDLEMYAEEIFKEKGNWSIASTIDKAEVETKSKTVKPNIKATIDVGDFKHNITIDKVSISPFGSQIIITEKIKDGRVFDKFALIDDKGRVLDLLGTDLRASGKATNSFEFIKGNVDMKYLKLIPIKAQAEGKELIEEKYSIKQLPITFKTSSIGSAVVEKIEFKKETIEVTYHNEGINIWEPSFNFYDSNGKEISLGDQGKSTSIDRESGRFVQRIKFSNPHADLSKIAQIGTFTGHNIELIKDQEIKVNLE